MKQSEYIKNKVSEYIKKSKLTDKQISRKTNIHARTIQSYRRKERVLRKYHYDQFVRGLRIANAKLKEAVFSYEEILSSLFDRCYHDYIYLILYLTKNKKINYPNGREDLVQSIFLKMWKHMDDLESKNINEIAFVKQITDSVICNRYHYYDRDKRIFPHEIASLDKELGENFHMIDTIKDDSQIIENLSDKLYVDELKKKLSARENFILEKRFFNPHTLSEVGEMLQISKERVRQIENRIFRKLSRYIQKIEGE